jgi:hypothetical protein
MFIIIVVVIIIIIIIIIINPLCCKCWLSDIKITTLWPTKQASEDGKGVGDGRVGGGDDDDDSENGKGPTPLHSYHKTLFSYRKWILRDLKQI